MNQQEDRTIKLFRKALKEIATTSEYSKVVDCTKGREKRELKNLKIVLDKTDDLDKVPIWALLEVITSPELYRDIITYMIMLENQLNTD